MNRAAETPSDGVLRHASLRECYERTDLRWRLAQIPDDAACRGLFLHALDGCAGARGARTQREYRHFFQTYQFSLVRLYPLKDYLTRLVVLAQIHYGAAGLQRGLYEIHAEAFAAWRDTLLGEPVFGPSRGDFLATLRAIELAYAAGTPSNYARFTVRADSDEHYVVRLEHEYLYLEHAMAGAIAGVARACNCAVALHVALESPFDGEIGITVL